MEYDFEDPNFDFAGNAEIIAAKLRKAREMQNTEAPRGIHAGNVFVASRPDIGGVLNNAVGRYEQAQAEQARGSMNTEQLRRYDELSRGLNEMKPIDYSNPDEAVMENSRRQALAGQMSKLNLPMAQKTAEIYMNKGAAFPETIAKMKMEQIERGEQNALKLAEIADQKRRDEEFKRWQAKLSADTRTALGVNANANADIQRQLTQARIDKLESEKAEKATKIQGGIDKVNEGRANVIHLLDSMDDDLGTLNEKGGIVNTENNWAKNIGSRVRGSTVGQLAGGAVGTDEQTLRDNMDAARGSLLLELKNAKNLPAAMMNSNMELQRQLKNLGSGPVSYQTLKKIIADARVLLNANYDNLTAEAGGARPQKDRTSAGGAAPNTKTYGGVTYVQKPGTTGKNKSDWIPQ